MSACAVIISAKRIRNGKNLAGRHASGEGDWGSGAGGRHFCFILLFNCVLFVQFKNK